MGKVYPFQIHPVLASHDHIFVRYESPCIDTAINWETTTGKSFDDIHYIKKNNLNPQAIDNGCYLRSLSDLEALGIVFRYMGAKIQEDSNNISRALPHFRKAYKLDSTTLLNYYSLARAHALNHTFDSSKIYIEKALKLDSTNARTWYLYGTTFEEKKEMEKAALYYDTALKYNPYHNRSLFRRGLIALRQEDMDKFYELLELLKEDGTANLFYIYNLERKLDKREENLE